MKGKQIGVVGLGVMGGAIISGAISAGFMVDNDIMIFDRDLQNSISKAVKYGYRYGEKISDINKCDVILLAVKPQNFRDVLSKLQPYINDDALVISVAAGITTDTIDEILQGKGRIVRVMPNTPVLVRKGVTAICRGFRVSDDDIAYVEKLFSSVGTSFAVEEKFIDIVSALSGSGPAYLFYIVEVLTEMAIAGGIDKGLSQKMVVETFEGALCLLKSQNKSPDTLRKEVTSPQGSTAAAIAVMETGNLAGLLTCAINAAVERNHRLGELM